MRLLEFDTIAQRIDIYHGLDEHCKVGHSLPCNGHADHDECSCNVQLNTMVVRACHPCVAGEG